MLDEKNQGSKELLRSNPKAEKVFTRMTRVKKSTHAEDHNEETEKYFSSLMVKSVSELFRLRIRCNRPCYKQLKLKLTGKW